MDSREISVIIPTLNGGHGLTQLLDSLKKQTLPPVDIIVIDSSSTDGSAERAKVAGAEVEVIPRSEFNHGRTRNHAARKARGSVLIFMTQDAMPVDEHFIEKLTQPLSDRRIAAVVGRQCPRPESSPTDAFHREFNYSSTSHRRSLDDLPRLGIKTYFFSNVAAAYDADSFWAVGGFPEGVIQNEDMIACSRLLHAGHHIAYEASAMVWHSHAYTLVQQFKRYFDAGVAISRAAAELPGAVSSREGARFVVAMMREFWRRRQFRWIPYAGVEAVVKLVAYKLGRSERYLPVALKKRVSLHRAFWARSGRTMP